MQKTAALRAAVFWIWKMDSYIDIATREGLSGIETLEFASKQYEKDQEREERRQVREKEREEKEMEREEKRRNSKRRRKNRKKERKRSSLS